MGFESVAKDVLLKQGLLGVIVIALVLVIVYMFLQYTSVLAKQADKCKTCLERSNKVASELLEANNKAISEARAEYQRNLTGIYDAMHDSTRQMGDTMERMNTRVAEAVTALTIVVSKFSGMLERLNGGK